jgi:uncharacterized membrane protein
MSKISTLSSLLGAAALAVASTASFAADQMPMGAKPGMEKCYGVAKAGKNDCAAGAHSCQGQSTKDFDKASFVSLPAGLCGKLAGGSTAAPAKM